MQGNHQGNLLKHIERNHPDEFLKIGMEKQAHDDGRLSTTKSSRKRKDTVAVRINAKRLKLACAEMVTVNARPFTCLEDSGFRQLIDPILEALNKESDSPQIAINRQNVQADISAMANDLRKQIADETRGKLICLKTDTATRLDRSLMGINIQYVHNGKLMLRTLAVKELFKSHTADNLRLDITEVLRRFNLDITSMYSCTTDNAANVIKCTELLDQDLKATSCSCPLQLYDTSVSHWKSGHLNLRQFYRSYKDVQHRNRKSVLN